MKALLKFIVHSQEIYAYIQLLEATYGAGTTIHALSITTLEKRLPSAQWESQIVDRADLETIKLAVICGSK